MRSDLITSIESKLQHNQPLTEEERAALLDVLHELKGLQVTLREFEVSHPQLVDTVNRVCVMLANLGI
ncbi:MAG TPA: DUF4404 family protein [Gammaproteobacteria bacterium]|nr:DUF4404 family protein [Gammaproteobacteria bacterium]